MKKILLSLVVLSAFISGSSYAAWSDQYGNYCPVGAPIWDCID